MNDEELYAKVESALKDNELYNADQIGEVLGRTGQTIRLHAAKNGIGYRTGKYFVFTKADALRFIEHIGNYGHPDRGQIYKEWPRDKFEEFVDYNYLDENGYRFSDTSLADKFDVTVTTIHGLRRRFKLALRILIGRGEEVTKEKIVDLVMKNSESKLRFLGRKEETLNIYTIGNILSNISKASTL